MVSVLLVFMTQGGFHVFRRLLTSIRVSYGIWYIVYVAQLWYMKSMSPLVFGDSSEADCVTTSFII